MNKILSKLLEKKKTQIKYNTQCLNSVPSTNTLLKERALKGEAEGAVIIADSQSAGKGRLDRSFFSPEGSGLYMSLLLRPSDRGITLAADKALMITTAASVSVCRAIEKVCKIKCGIKWVNDVFCDGKKVCGILTEGALIPNTSNLDYAVLGIGVNIREPDNGFPENIAHIAGALFPHTYSGSTDYVRAQLAAEILADFADSYVKSICAEQALDKAFINEYISRSVLDGRRVEVSLGNSTMEATAIGINDDCSLTVITNEKKVLKLTYGEVRIKLLDRHKLHD
ncbi:MAG: biotin--[Clostridia bacterium]|nr:biotin--[acetyl-CoA-carboxylase] ligase [Clostridia bacterium]